MREEESGSSFILGRRRRSSISPSPPFSDTLSVGDFAFAYPDPLLFHLLLQCLPVLSPLLLGFGGPGLDTGLCLGLDSW